MGLFEKGFIKKEGLVAQGRALISIASLALAGCGRDGDDAPRVICESPRKISTLYEGDPAAKPGDQANWEQTVLARTEIGRRGVIEAVAGFRSPGGPWNESYPVSRHDADEIVFKIGEGQAEFTVYLRAYEGSSVCNEEPSTTFIGPQHISEVPNSAVFPRW